MRVLDQFEIEMVSGAYCPVCFAATVCAFLGASSTVWGYVSNEGYLYASGAVLLGLATVVSVQIFLGH